MSDEPTVISLLIGRMDELGKRIDTHITDCSAQSKRLFWAVVTVLGYLVSHDYLPKVFGPH